MSKTAFRCAKCARSWPLRFGLEIGFNVVSNGQRKGSRHGYRCLDCGHRGWTTRTDWLVIDKRATVIGDTHRAMFAMDEEKRGPLRVAAFESLALKK